jgi:truncated hemoglobin YjbI
MWIAEIFGGPKSYSEQFGKDTAHPHMMSRHLEQQRFRWVETREVRKGQSIMY